MLLKGGTTQEWHSFFLSWHEKKKLELEEASLRLEEAIKRCARADVNLQIISPSSEAHSASAHERVDNEVTGVEDGIKEELSI